MKKHYAAAISAFVIWGFFPVLLKALSGYPAGEILYFRILFSTLILSVIVFGFRKKHIRSDWEYFSSFSPTKRKEVIFLTLAGGTLLTINWLTFIYIINNINIKTASFSYLICPVITAVLGFVLIKERLTLLQWIAVGLCGLSCVMMGIGSLLELGYSFLTAVTYALYLITQRRNQGFDRLVMLGIQVLFSFLILNLFYSQLIQATPVATEFYTIIIIIAGFFTVFPLFLNLFALNKINSATIGILMYINPLLNFTIAFLVYKESISSIQIAGYVIIAVALVLFNYTNFVKLTAVVAPQGRH
jgi:chloramphenicol-sensitive protein RarD